MTAAFDALAARIRREGAVRFDVAVEALLYGDGGFFATGDGGAGRRRDFVTSVEVGPLFGAVVAHALDAEWERLRRPDPFVVVEAGAGRGALARAVLDAAPRCLPCLRYVCVERSAGLRAASEELLPVEPATNVFGPVLGGDADEPAAVVPGGGPVVVVLDDLPMVPVTGVVLANELLDNLPFRLLERRDGVWCEVLVALEDDRLVELPIGAPPEVVAEAAALAPGAADGDRVPLQHEAAAWVRRALSVLERGRLVVVDYAAPTTASLASRPWREWLRTYRAHQIGGHPLDDPGLQDVTCEVAIDQLHPRPASDVAQADWLRAHGIDGLVQRARETWQERAHLGDLEAMKARSRIGEADAVTDPTGLGAFRVLEWVV